MKNVEWSMTAAPSWGCMFCMDPAHGPCSMPRQSPKYRQVSDSGPNGRGGASYPMGDTGQPPATPFDLSVGSWAAVVESPRATSLVSGPGPDVC